MSKIFLTFLKILAPLAFTRLRQSKKPASANLVFALAASISSSSGGAAAAATELT